MRTTTETLPIATKLTFPPPACASAVEVLEEESWYDVSVSPPPDRAPTLERLEPAEAGSPRYRVRLQAEGSLQLPAELCQRLGVGTGNYLLLSLEPDGSVRLTSLRALAAKAEGLYAGPDSRSSPVDELSAERVDEARREDEE